LRGTETLSVETPSADASDSAAVLGCFGWRLLAQEPTTPGRTVLTFSRRRDLPHLDRLRELEAEYFALAPQASPPRCPRPLWLWGPLLAMGLGVPFWVHRERTVQRLDLESARREALRVEGRRRALESEARALCLGVVSQERRPSRG
jgi:hypothetical protein